MRFVVIMAGGSGKRLWPLSRQGMPKQLLRLVGEKSLLRLAYERVRRVVGDEQIFVCTGADYADTVVQELPELDPSQILGEPIGRDSLNAVAWPAAVLAERDPDAVVAMVTADQIMKPVEAFVDAVETGFRVAETQPDVLVTFGVVPSTPHTGYGYLRRGAELEGFADVCEVREFKEKPDRETARRYLDSGQYWWNSGMFVWRATTVLDQLARLMPDCHEIVTTLARSPEQLADLYPKLPKISVDYALMEPVSRGRGTARVCAVRLPIEWFDVGGFPALAEHMDRDDHGNAVDGRTILLDAENNLVINKTTDGGLVALLGLTDTVVVKTEDITLVCPASEAERIKELVGRVAEEWGELYA